MGSARQLVEVVARALADDPSQVTVTEAEHRGVAVLDVYMAPGELGRLIGRQGRTAQAIRTLAQVTAGDRKVQVEFRDGAPRR
ncbi:MAG: KH domain-containing protein [Acidobacteria bacterium]|nr:KH domain-containing protein [Acidobacteriota bacterium]